MKAAPTSDAAGGAAFPWDKAMAAGLGLLRLSPRDFWTTTPRELNAAVGANLPRPAVPLERDELAALMQRYPD